MDAALPAAGSAIREALKGARVLMAYGLFGELFASLRPLGVDYMGAQALWLRETLGAETAVIRLPTGAAVAENAERMRVALLADPRPTVLIAHSKGGLEALAALREAEAAARCRAFLAIQSPFFGSPVADALTTRPGLSLFAGRALRIARLRHRGLLDLTTPVREAWMRDNRAFIARLVGSVPVICCASSLTGGATGADRRYVPLARWMEREGAGPNDGLVPVRSALLPGARHIVMAGSHRALVAAGRGRDPLGTLERMLALALLSL